MTCIIPHPGKTLLEDTIQPSGLTVAAAAERLGIAHEALSAVLESRAAIDAALAVRLEQAGVGAAYTWLAMQIRHDLAQARLSPPTVQAFPNSERPRSYMTDEERDQLLAAGMSENGILGVESSAADKAGDKEAAWAWLALADLPAHTLAYLKDRRGAGFIRSRGFNTADADTTYGPSWLDA